MAQSGRPSVSDKLAAQNVAMSGGAGQNMIRDPWAGRPAPQPMAQSGNPGFNVSRGMPDLSALDEAYRREQQGS
jgi:hypothetical protein